MFYTLLFLLRSLMFLWRIFLMVQMMLLAVPSVQPLLLPLAVCFITQRSQVLLQHWNNHVVAELHGIIQRCVSPPETPNSNIEMSGNVWNYVLISISLYLSLMWGLTLHTLVRKITASTWPGRYFLFVFFRIEIENIVKTWQMIERHLLRRWRGAPCASRNLAAPCLQTTGQTWRRVKTITFLFNVAFLSFLCIFKRILEVPASHTWSFCTCQAYVVKKKIILIALTSSETTHHHCGLQTSGSPRSCSNGAQGRSSLLTIPPDMSSLLPYWTHLVVVGRSPGVVFLREVSQVVVIVEVEARHQLLFWIRS